MAERITKADLAAVCDNLNRRLDGAGSNAEVVLQERNGYTGADEYNRATGSMTRTLYAGTKREVFDALWNMIRGIDLLAIR